MMVSYIGCILTYPLQLGLFCLRSCGGVMEKFVDPLQIFIFSLNPYIFFEFSPKICLNFHGPYPNHIFYFSIPPPLKISNKTFKFIIAILNIAFWARPIHTPLQKKRNTWSRGLAAKRNQK